MMRFMKRVALLGAALFICTMAIAGYGAADKPTLVKIGPTLYHPWGMDFLGNDAVLVSERRGNLFRINLATGSARQIGNIPAVYHNRQGGLLDVLVDGEWVYLCYSAVLTGGSATAIDRARLDADGKNLTNRTAIFTANHPTRSGHHFGCRMVIPRVGSQAGYLFASLGDRGKRDNAQDPGHHAGSIIRLHPDGRIPADNPKIDSWAPEIWSIGHRNPQGMAVNPQNGNIWAHEHGPRGGDEINSIVGGENYGWPTVSHGREYATGMRVSKHKSLPGYADPEWVWDPSIAPSGMAFYPHNASMFPAFAGHLLIGSLKFRQLWLLRMSNDKPMDERIVIDGKGGDGIGRIRDVAIAPDGSILLLNDEASGGLYRISR